MPAQTRNLSPLSPRLAAAAAYVRQDAVFADIGSDHGYLPVFLAQSGRIARGYATDINKQPLARAASNIRLGGVGGIVEARLSDGLSGMDGLGLTDIAICGMGGELIAAIIEAAPFVRSENVRLILQPMSRAYALRRYLGEGGFNIFSETLAAERGDIFVCICAGFDGVVRSSSEAELYLGAHNIARGGEEFRELCRVCISAQRRKTDGMKRSGRLSTETEKALLAELNDIYGNIKAKTPGGRNL